jgi:hypothetical protein
MPRHEIRIRFDGDNAALTIDGKTINVSSDMALLIDEALRTFTVEWLMKVEDGTFISPTDTMRIVIRSNGNNEVEFVIEE